MKLKICKNSIILNMLRRIFPDQWRVERGQGAVSPAKSFKRAPEERKGS
jgi:hypothetical protein